MAKIQKITKATEIAQKSFLQLDISNNKSTEKEIAFDLVRYMIKNGASKESFDTIVASGPNSSLPHAMPQDNTLSQPVLIDWGALFEGYCSDNTRTMVYTERQHEIWDIVCQSHDKAIKAIRPGVKCCEIDKVARDIIADYGYGDNFIHSTGHGIGLNIHEYPGFSPRDDTIIEEGMVITVVTIQSGPAQWRAKGEQLIFPGFLSVSPAQEADASALPELRQGQKFMMLVARESKKSANGCGRIH